MVLALYLAIIMIAAFLFGATWIAAMWGASIAALTPLYLLGLLIVAGLVLGARYVRKIPMPKGSQGQERKADVIGNAS